jgi:orotate phosphoribosyltransferase
MDTTNTVNFINTKQTSAYVAAELHNKKIFQIKDTVLSSGKTSPYYCDLRQILSHPQLLTVVTDYMIFKIKEHTITFDRIASVPLGSVPFASIVASKMDVPSIMIRDKAKSHGNKRMFEGVINVDDNILLIEDVITTGASVIETITKIRNRGANVVGVMCILDRQEGGAENIAYNFSDIPVYSMFTVSTLLNSLLVNKLIVDYDAERIRFFQDCQYKEMLHVISKRNRDILEVPEYIKDPCAFMSSQYPLAVDIVTGNSTTQQPQDVILDFTEYINMDIIKGNIIRANKKVRSVILSASQLEAARDELHEQRKTHMFNIIIDTNTVLGMPKSLDLMHIDNDIAYFADYVINNAVINNPDDMDRVINELKEQEAHGEYRCQAHKLIQFRFPNTAVIGNEEMWLKLRDYVTGLNNKTYIAGVVFNIGDFAQTSVPKKVAIGQWVPVFLRANKCMDFHLTKDNSGTELFSNFVSAHKPFGYMIGEDIISSPSEINERIQEYRMFIDASLHTNPVKSFNNEQSELCQKAISAVHTSLTAQRESILSYEGKESGDANQTGWLLNNPVTKLAGAVGTLAIYYVRSWFTGKNKVD